MVFMRIARASRSENEGRFLYFAKISEKLKRCVSGSFAAYLPVRTCRNAEQHAATNTNMLQSMATYVNAAHRAATQHTVSISFRVSG